MVNLGAQGSDGELNKVLLYLVKFYGGAGGSAPNAPMAGSANPQQLAAVGPGQAGLPIPNQAGPAGGL